MGASEEDVKLLLEEFEKNEKWFDENYEWLQEKYPDKVLAIKDQKVIAVKTELEDLIKELEMKKEDINLVFITSIPPKGIAFIL